MTVHTTPEDCTIYTIYFTIDGKPAGSIQATYHDADDDPVTPWASGNGYSVDDVEATWVKYDDALCLKRDGGCNRNEPAPRVGSNPWWGMGPSRRTRRE